MCDVHSFPSRENPPRRPLAFPLRHLFKLQVDPNSPPTRRPVLPPSALPRWHCLGAAAFPLVFFEALAVRVARLCLRRTGKAGRGASPPFIFHPCSRDISRHVGRSEYLQKEPRDQTTKSKSLLLFGCVLSFCAWPYELFKPQNPRGLWGAGSAPLFEGKEGAATSCATLPAAGGGDRLARGSRSQFDVLVWKRHWLLP